MATRTDTQPPALHDADSHDLIRVHGARVNNLKDVSVEIPKRRLTVFTGVSGSGKSSLVFGTIAAESQRLINETYSAFVQGFMPTLARPDVDVLEGLTTAIIVDQERMGADPRSTVGTATDANAMLRILFSRLGQPHIGSPERVLLQRRLGPGQRRDHGRARRQDQDREGDLHPHRRHVPALRGPGLGHRLRPVRAVRRQQVAQRGRAHDPRLQHGRLVRPHLPRLRLLRPGQADQEVQQAGAARPALQGADQDQGRGHQPDVRGADPADPEVVPVQGRRRDAAAHPRLRGAGGDVHHLPRVRRHPAQPRRPGRRRSRGRQHRRRLRDADQRPRRVGARPGRAVGGAAAGGAGRDPRLVRGDRARLPQPRPAVGHALGRRGAAHQDDPPPRVVADRRHLRLRRADDRAAPARHPADERPAAAAARQGQHRAGRGAQAGGDRDRRPRRRPRPRRRHRGRRGGVRGHRRRAAGRRHAHRAPPGRPGVAEAGGADAVRGAGGARRRPPTTCRTSTSTSRSGCWSSSPAWRARARAR